MDHFARLPECCISQILSLTSPLDTVRSSSVSKGFKSAADSDAVWQSFLPSDYQEIISRSNSPIHCSNSTLSQKQLYFMLCDSPFLIDRGNKVISLNPVCWLDIRCIIETRMLSQKTNYAAYLVFSFEEGSQYGFDCSINFVIRFIDLDDNSEAENRALSTIIYLQQPQPRRDFMKHGDRVPRSRADGWMEVKMGSFYNDQGDDGDDGTVEARLMEIKGLHGIYTNCILIEGIEFRPN